MSQTLNSEAPTVLWRRLLQRISVTFGISPKELTRFVKFAIVGVIGMAVDLTILTISREVLGLPLSLAVALGFTVAVVSNFTWNRFWTFPESRQRPIATQLVQFALVNLVGLGINEVIVLGLYPVFLRLSHDPVAYLAAKVIAIGVVLFWNYGRTVFGPTKESNSPPGHLLCVSPSTTHLLCFRVRGSAATRVASFRLLHQSRGSTIQPLCLWTPTGRANSGAGGFSFAGSSNP